MNHYSRATDARDRSRGWLRSLAFACLFALFTLTLLGCASLGQPFASAMVAELQVGETTQSEVRALFGDPWRVGIEDGRRTWTYGNYRYSLLHPLLTNRAEDLVVHFDAHGIVRHYAYNTTTPHKRGE